MYRGKYHRDQAVYFLSTENKKEIKQVHHNSNWLGYI